MSFCESDMEMKIIQDIKESDHYSECGYDSWKHFLSDANMGSDKEKYDEVLYKNFTEKELEILWKHYNK